MINLLVPRRFMFGRGTIRFVRLCVRLFTLGGGVYSSVDPKKHCIDFDETLHACSLKVCS